MSTSHLVLAFVLAAIATNLTDWFFFGVLFHKKYLVYPEVWWRPRGGAGETKAIVWSSLLSLLSIAGFILACSAFSIRGYKPAFELAALIWLMAPLPMTITNALFVKMHPLIVLTHCLGWFARFMIVAIAVGWLLS
ncbi:MAG: DUF1761 family protein [Candidatus Acidiferrales bacterium]